MLVVLAALLGRNDALKIAVLGAGIGGTAVSYHIKQLLPKAEVTVFESGKIGGRLATTQIAGHEYETGGSIIHPANREAYIFNNCTS